MRSLLILIFVTFLSLNSFGQIVPGYQGKRLDAGLKLQLVAYPTFSEGDIFYYAWPTVHAEANYVVSRKLSVGVYGRQTITGRINVSNFRSDNPDLRDGLSIWDETYSRLNYSANTVGIAITKFKFRKQGAIAPVGKYWTFNLGYLNARIRDKDGIFFTSGEQLIGSAAIPMMGYGIGRRTVYKQDYLIDYLVRFEFSPYNWFDSGADGVDFDLVESSLAYLVTFQIGLLRIL